MEEETQENQEQSQEQTAQTQQKDESWKEELTAMKAELDALKSSQFATQQSQAQTQASQAPQFTAEQIKAFQDNPALMAQWIAHQAELAKTEVRNESQKQVWDKKAYDKFPLLNTDKDFQRRVTSQMREFIAQGEYGKDNPMLLYRAAQIVGAEYAPKSLSKSTTNVQTSVESRSNVSRSSTDLSQKVKIDDNDPRLRFGQVLGMTGDKLKRFKEELAKRGPYEASQRRSKTRSLGR